VSYVGCNYELQKAPIHMVFTQICSAQRPYRGCDLYRRRLFKQRLRRRHGGLGVLAWLFAGLSSGLSRNPAGLLWSARCCSNTSNRAELCAVIAALRFKYWPSVFRIVVIATDSYYVVAGATVWAKTWIENGWETASGEPVKNQDLWEELLREVKRYKNANAQVQFWRIPREWNEVADAAAKRACR
jgi:ribonuclease HI